jgi:hypothetical protein
MKRQPTLPTFGEIVPGAGGRLGAIMRGALVNGVREPDYAVIVPDDKAPDLGKMQVGQVRPGRRRRREPDRRPRQHRAMAKAGCAAALKGRGPAHRRARRLLHPGRAEYWALRANVPELFAKEWHWTSTQGSRYSAFVQDFEHGDSGWTARTASYRVRAVRRIQLQHFDA